MSYCYVETLFKCGTEEVILLFSELSLGSIYKVLDTHDAFDWQYHTNSRENGLFFGFFLAFLAFFLAFFGFFRFFFLYFGLGFVMIYTTPLKSIDSTVMGLKSELADTGCKYHFGTYFWVLES